MRAGGFSARIGGDTPFTTVGGGGTLELALVVSIGAATIAFSERLQPLVTVAALTPAPARMPCIAARASIERRSITLLGLAWEVMPLKGRGGDYTRKRAA